MRLSERGFLGSSAPISCLISARIAVDEAAPPGQSSRRLVLPQGALHEDGGAPARAARAVGGKVAAQPTRRGTGAQEATARDRAAPQRLASTRAAE